MQVIIIVLAKNDRPIIRLQNDPIKKTTNLTENIGFEIQNIQDELSGPIILDIRFMEID